MSFLLVNKFGDISFVRDVNFKKSRELRSSPLQGTRVEAEVALFTPRVR